MGLQDKKSILQKTKIICSSSGSELGSLIKKKLVCCTMFNITICSTSDSHQ